jgi:hypothetical protein
MMRETAMPLRARKSPSRRTALAFLAEGARDISLTWYSVAVLDEVGLHASYTYSFWDGLGDCTTQGAMASKAPAQAARFSVAV